MAARLTRARKSLAHERFEVPVGAALEERVGLAADIAYLAFTAGYAPASGSDVVRSDLSAEAIRLVRVLRDLLPDHTELDALLALVLLQHSRRDARVARRRAGAARPTRTGPGGTPTRSTRRWRCSGR